MSSDCPTKLLADTPSLHDQFGSHERVAKAITQLVLTEEGGKCVGLEGSWGSGKSTIIKLLEDELANETNKVLIIDAWAHEGDRLRRTVLERLIGGLRDWMTIAQLADWDKKANELACRIRESTKKSYPIFARWAKYLLFCSTLLFPIGLAFLNAGLREGVTIWRPGRPWAWEFNLGLAMVASPLLPVAIHFFNAWKYPKLVRTKADAEEFWSFFAQKFSTEEYSTTIENPEPTSVEFACIYNNLMSDILADSERRVVIVLDNLDRVTAEDATSIWSTMQIFLHNQEYTAKEWYSRLWVVVPYDPVGIKRLWLDNEDTNIAQSFINKTFQVRFEVPPPALSDWRKYFVAKLIEAMPNHNSEDFYNVVRFYGSYYGRSAPAPTPRAIINIVNQIGALHRQWHDDISIVHMAAYTLLRQDAASIQQFVSALIEGKVFTNREDAREVAGEGINESLAMLAFNLEARRAQQLLLHEPIVTAFESRDGRELARLADAFEGFWEVMESMELTQYIAGDESKLSSIASCLANSSLLLKASLRQEAITVTQELRRAIDDMDSFKSINSKLVDGLASLLLFIKDCQLAADLVQKVSATPMWHNQAETSLVQGWVEGMLLLTERLNEYGFEDVYESGITVPNGPEGYVLVCGTISRLDCKNKIKLIPNEEINEIVEYLANQEFLERSQADTMATLRTIMDAKIAVDWTKLAYSIQVLLYNLETEGTKTIYGLIELLLEIQGDCESAKKTLRTLVEDGVIMHWFSLATDSSDFECMGLCLYVHLLSNNDASAPKASFGNSGYGYDQATHFLQEPSTPVVSAFFDTLKKYRQRSFLFTLLSQAPIARSLVEACLKNAALSAEGRMAFTSKSIVDHWRDIESILGTNQFQKLISVRLSESDLLQYVYTTQYSYQYTGLYLFIARAGGTESRNFSDWCIAGMRDISLEQWQSDLTMGGPCTELVIDLVEKGFDIGLGDELCEALSNHADNAAISDCRPSDLTAKWELLPCALEHSSRRDLAVYLCRLAVTKRGNNILAGYFQLYGRSMFDEKALLNTEGLMTDLFIPIVKLKGSKSAGRKWLTDVLKKFPNLLIKYKPRDEVKEFISATNKAAHPLLGKADPLLVQIYDLLPTKKR